MSEDQVNSPKHYNSGLNGIETIDAIKAGMSNRDQWIGYLKGNALKYLHRFEHKGKARQDLAKSRWHQDKLDEELANGEQIEQDIKREPWLFDPEGRYFVQWNTGTAKREAHMRGADVGENLEDFARLGYEFRVYRLEEVK